MSDGSLGAAPPTGGYQVGWQLTPLCEGDLDTSGDFNGGPHEVEEDPLYKMACENRDGGNKMCKENRHEEAVARYSELIMQLRGLGEEKDVIWTPAGEEAVRQLRAAAYLNLSLCFIKQKQWTHASNTATRALQGDKDPVDPKENVLSPEKKAKALFRRAQAQSEGFQDFDKAKIDLEKALEYTPEDKALQQELQRIKQVVKKNQKEQDKAMGGFLGKSKKAASGEGIFDDKLRPSNESSEPKITEVKKISDGLWLAPQEEKKKTISADGEIDFEEVSREINELREDNPKAYAELRDKVKAQVEEQARLAEEDAKEGGDAAAAGADDIVEAAKAKGAAMVAGVIPKQQKEPVEVN